MLAISHHALRWTALALLSFLLVAILESLRLPAAVLLGAMAAAVTLAAANANLRVAPRLFYIAQALIGCMISRAFPVAVFTEMAKYWPIFLGGVLSVVAASTVLGWLLARWQVLPGSTAVWGSWPGAATAMTLMAESYGADTRLVAFMQYLRVVLVAVIATVVARLWTSAPAHVATIVWFPAVSWPTLFATLGIAIVGVAAGHLLRIPAGALLVPMVVGALVQDTGIMKVELPPWLLAIAYVLLGWSIGLRFTRPILAYAAKALPRILASILCLVAICGGFAALLVAFAGVDPLTAYLATSPGGADSVAIIASSSKVDMSFVMAMQTARFLLVLLAGPPIARIVATRATHATKSRLRDT